MTYAAHAGPTSSTEIATADRRNSHWNRERIRVMGVTLTPSVNIIIRNDNLFLGTTGITGTAPPRAGAAAVVRRCKSAAEGRRVRLLFRPNMLGEMVGDHRY